MLLNARRLVAESRRAQTERRWQDSTRLAREASLVGQAALELALDGAATAELRAMLSVFAVGLLLEADSWSDALELADRYLGTPGLPTRARRELRAMRAIAAGCLA